MTKKQAEAIDARLRELNLWLQALVTGKPPAPADLNGAGQPPPSRPRLREGNDD